MFSCYRETPAKKKSNTQESSLSLEDTGVTRITPIEQDIKSVVLFICLCVCVCMFVVHMLVPQFCLFVCSVVHFLFVCLLCGTLLFVWRFSSIPHLASQLHLFVCLLHYALPGKQFPCLFVCYAKVDLCIHCTFTLLATSLVSFLLILVHFCRALEAVPEESSIFKKMKNLLKDTDKPLSLGKNSENPNLKREDSYRLLWDELGKKEPTSTRESLCKTLQGVAVLRARLVLATLLSNWPQEGRRLSTTFLGCSDIIHYFCLLDLLLHQQTTEEREKVRCGREEGRGGDEGGKG